MREIPPLHVPIIVVAQPEMLSVNLVDVRGFVTELSDSPYHCTIHEVLPNGTLGRRGTIAIKCIELDDRPSAAGYIAPALSAWLEIVENWRKNEQLKTLAERYGLTVDDVLRIAAEVIG